VAVSRTGNTSKRIPKGMVLRHMSAYSGTGAAISREDWAALVPSPTTAPDATVPVEQPHVHTSIVPEGLRPQVLAIREKHRAFWSSAFQNPGFSPETGMCPDVSRYICRNLCAIECESKTEVTAGKLTACSDAL